MLKLSSVQRIAHTCLFILLASLSASASQVVKGTARKFPLELDHVFVWVAKGAPEAEALQKAGLHLQPETNQHTGQGTASKIFIFENLYLELIWIEDEQAAAKNAARSGTDMLRRARWQQTGASPFGVGLHRLTGAEAALPFPVKSYWSEWMQPNTVIEFAQSVTNEREPMYFVLPGYLSINTPAMAKMLNERFNSSRHPLGASRLTNLRIVTTSKTLSPTSQQLVRGGVMKVERGTKPLAELTFDDGKQEKSVDFRPQLPIVLKY